MLVKWFFGIIILGMAATIGHPSWAAGDAAAGEKTFKKCKACHLVDGPKHRVGPSLQNLMGRTAGTA